MSAHARQMKTITWETEKQTHVAKSNLQATAADRPSFVPPKPPDAGTSTPPRIANTRTGGIVGTTYKSQPAKLRSVDNSPKHVAAVWVHWTNAQLTRRLEPPSEEGLSAVVVFDTVSEYRTPEWTSRSSGAEARRWWTTSASTWKT